MNCLAVLVTKIIDVQEQKKLIVFGNHRIKSVLSDKRLTIFCDAWVKTIWEIEKLHKPLCQRGHSCSGCRKVNTVVTSKCWILNGKEH